jgi:hypothetical protein
MLGTVLLFLNLPLFTAHVSRALAQTGGLGISKVTFDRISYALGSSGTVTVSVNSVVVPSDVSSCTVYFYSIKTDGSTKFWYAGSGPSPPGNVPVGTTMLSYTFTTPTDTGIVSGPIYCIATVAARQNGEFLDHTTLLARATDSGNNICVLSNPDYPSYLEVVSDHDSLQLTYASLQNIYDSLRYEHDSLTTEVNSVRNQLNSLQTLVYGLATLTIVLLTTTIYFVRRPRMKS